MNDPILDSSVITNEGMFLKQISDLYPDLRQQFLAAAKLYIRGVKKKFRDIEKWNAITESVYGLTTFVSLIMLENYEYAHVLEEEAQIVTLPDAVPAIDELFERAKDALSIEIGDAPAHIPGNVVAVRYVFRFYGDPRICFLVVGLTDHDSLRAVEHTDKNVFFVDRDLQAAEALLHGKTYERVKNEISTNFARNSDLRGTRQNVGNGDDAGR